MKALEKIQEQIDALTVELRKDITANRDFDQRPARNAIEQLKRKRDRLEAKLLTVGCPKCSQPFKAKPWELHIDFPTESGGEGKIITKMPAGAECPRCIIAALLHDASLRGKVTPPNDPKLG